MQCREPSLAAPLRRPDHVSGAVLALTAELLAVRNFQRTFLGFNWVSAASFMLAVWASLFAFVMSVGIVEFLYYHMSDRYDTLSMVIALLLGIARCAESSASVGRRGSTPVWRSPHYASWPPPTVLVLALTAWAVFREIFPK